MVRHVVGVFDETSAVQPAAETLLSEGVSKDRLSVLRWEDPRHGEELLEYDHEERTEAIGEGFRSGGALGGIAGLLAGAISLVAGPLGVVAIVGPLASALGGATIGAAIGGFVGTLRKLGLTHDEAEHLMEKLESGSTLLAVSASSAEAPGIEARLRALGAVETKTI